MRKTTRLLSLFLQFLCIRYAKSATYNIRTAEEYNTFATKVNSGSNFKGTTVYLINDLDFTGAPSQNFKPAGTYTSDSSYKEFAGVFDGQGHTVSNLVASSNAVDVGLLGYSRGSIVKNVVIDSTCSVTGTYSGTYYLYIGAVIGRCYSYNRECTLENSVNMASVLFSGRLSSLTSMVGGFSGEFGPINYQISVRNCINRGSVTYTGYSYTNTYVAGIIGKFYNSDGAAGVIENCVNYGIVTSTGTTRSSLFMGGITGRFENGDNVLRNCVNFGNISYSKATRSSTYVGGVIGDVKNNAVSNSYWTGEISGYASSSGTVSGIYSFDSDLVLSDGRSLIEVMKEIVGGDSKCIEVEYHCNGGRLMNFPDNDIVKVIEIDDSISYPVKTNNSFIGWYTDATMETPLGSELPDKLTIYAKYGWNISFDTDGGSECQDLVLEYNEMFTPTSFKEGYTLTWTTDKDITKKNSTTYYVPAYDVKFTATWDLNSYKLNFVFNNSVDDDIESILVYGSPITYPDNPVREGYTFYGWDNDTQFMPGEDLTITALWDINNYTITFVYNNSVDDDRVVIVDYDTFIPYPDDPVKEGYSFDGWDNDTQFMPADDLTITALWTINNYTLTFVFNNSVDDDKVDLLDFETPITYPDDPVREGYTFYKWDKDTQFMPSDDLTITALWTINNYTLTFVFNNSVNDDKVVVVDYNTPISYPDDPVKEGYSFNGWDKDDKLMPANSLTITALWTINNYTLTFVFNNNDDNKVVIVDYNAPIPYPDDPVKEGYSFVGWDKDTQFMPADELTITALWIKKSRFVNITIGNTDMTKSEIIDLLGKYTDSEFSVDQFEYDKTEGTTHVTIGFDDFETANKFVSETKEKIKDDENSPIKEISIAQEEPSAYSMKLYPLFVSILFFMF